MIANISPSCTAFEETHNTLKYASRAKNIRRKVVANRVSVQAHISQYKAIIGMEEIVVLHRYLCVCWFVCLVEGLYSVCLELFA